MSELSATPLVHKSRFKRAMIRSGLYKPGSVRPLERADVSIGIVEVIAIASALILIGYVPDLAIQLILGVAVVGWLLKERISSASWERVRIRRMRRELRARAGCASVSFRHETSVAINRARQKYSVDNESIDTGSGLDEQTRIAVESLLTWDLTDQLRDVGLLPSRATKKQGIENRTSREYYKTAGLASNSASASSEGCACGLEVCIPCEFQDPQFNSKAMESSESDIEDQIRESVRKEVSSNSASYFAASCPPSQSLGFDDFEVLLDDFEKSLLTDDSESSSASAKIIELKKRRAATV